MASRSKPAQPGTVSPRMHKMFDGRNIATRPIPVIHDTSDDRAITSDAIQQAPRGEIMNFPQGPRPKAGVVLGQKVRGGAKTKAGTYNPRGVEDNR